MKYSIYVFCLILVVSCHQNSKEASILGSWTMDQDTVKYSKGGFLDKLTFLPNDSLKIEATLDGKLLELNAGIYSWNKRDRILTTEVSGEKRQFEIIKLSDSRMSLKDEKNKVVENYKRL